MLALIGAVKAVNIVADIGTGLDEHSAVDLYATNRYIGADGKPIILAETEGHARVTLERVQKYQSPQPLDIINLETDSCDTDNKLS